MWPAMYSVYKKPNDEPIAIHKNRVQCAAAMGVKLASFDSIASQIRKGKRNHKTWDIYRHEEESDAEE
jgi:hypothetical protein